MVYVPVREAGAILFNGHGKELRFYKNEVGMMEVIAVDEVGHEIKFKFQIETHIKILKDFIDRQIELQNSIGMIGFVEDEEGKTFFKISDVVEGKEGK